MNLEYISLKNLLRRKIRSFFVFFTVFVCTTALVSIYSLSYTFEKDVGDKLDRYGANILVVPATDALSIKYGDMVLGSANVSKRTLSYGDIDRIRSIPLRERLSSVLPVFYTPLEIDGREVIFMGAETAELSRIKPWWGFDGMTGKDSFYLGSEISRALGKKKGDSITVEGKAYLVGGVIPSTGDKEDYMVIADLKKVWGLSGFQGMVSVFEVSALCKDCPVDDIVNQISSVLPGARVTSIRRVVQSKTEMVGKLRKFGILLFLFISAIGAMVIGVTISSSVEERKKEIGILRSIGYRRRWILKLVMYEAGILSFLGALSGSAGGVVAATLIALSFNMERVVIPHPVLILAVTLGLAMGVGSAVLPAVKAASLDPVEALRDI